MVFQFVNVSFLFQKKQNKKIESQPLNKIDSDVNMMRSVFRW
jgi:hypothetical protein